LYQCIQRFIEESEVWVVFSSDTTGFSHPHNSMGSTITHCINAYKGDARK